MSGITQSRNASVAFCRRRSAIALAGALLFAGLSPGAALAQDDYPSKPIKLVIPYATGGVSDAMGRMVATALSKVLGQSVVTENRGGAGGTLGAGVVAKSAPDGYTLLLTSPPMVAVAPALLRDLPYDTAKDFSMVGTFATTPNVLVVNTDLPVKSIIELVAYAKGPGKGKLSFASAGPGSTGHLSGHILSKETGIDMQHIPYKSSGQAFPDVISGRVSMVFDSLPSTIGHVRSGKVRPLLVMSDKRSSVMPDVPTAVESGFPQATMNFWVGLEGPAKMPKSVVDKLNAALKKAVETKEMRDQMAFLGAEPYYTSAAEMDSLRSKDIVKYGKLVKDMGLKPE
jgi:tripartite-type tricarboxylate transporter receptor subunit TctC